MKKKAANLLSKSSFWVRQSADSHSTSIFRWLQQIHAGVIRGTWQVCECTHVCMSVSQIGKDAENERKQKLIRNNNSRHSLHGVEIGCTSGRLLPRQAVVIRTISSSFSNRRKQHQPASPVLLVHQTSTDHRSLF
jgi:hypothetical protein